MKLFACSGCGQPVFFENTFCTACGALLGFVPGELRMQAFEPATGSTWRPLGQQGLDGNLHRRCRNYKDQSVCNWMVPDHEPDDFCIACRLNQTIPDLSRPENHGFWHSLETEKRRLVYSLLQLGLPLQTRTQDPTGLAFDFLEDVEPTFTERGQRVLTGHADGLITLNIAEADPVRRERMRSQMDEPYRTLLGHFRHESGHYYWDKLIRDSHWLFEFRDRFGNEQQDYAAALQQHYEQGPPPDWQDHYVSAYASTHPWEDWAETWAHYLHIVDTLETAGQFGISVFPLFGNTQVQLDARFSPGRAVDFDWLIQAWLPLSTALNSLNRSMGHAHAYPFVLAPAVIDKLRLVHRVIMA